jgi:hypothetical protein
MSIKTFRGSMSDLEVSTIRLGTNDGLTGYRIVKFQLIPVLPGGAVQDSVMQIFTREQAAASATVEFDNPTLLAAAVYSQHQTQYTFNTAVIFDSVKFNQDIYITHKDEAVGQSCNYYLELEKVALNLNEATVATLKDMRGRE